MWGSTRCERPQPTRSLRSPLEDGRLAPYVSANRHRRSRADSHAFTAQRAAGPGQRGTGRHDWVISDRAWVSGRCGRAGQVRVGVGIHALRDRAVSTLVDACARCTPGAHRHRRQVSHTLEGWRWSKSGEHTATPDSTATRARERPEAGPSRPRRDTRYSDIGQSATAAYPRLVAATPRLCWAASNAGSPRMVPAAGQRSSTPTRMPSAPAHPTIERFPMPASTPSVPSAGVSNRGGDGQLAGGMPRATAHSRGRGDDDDLTRRVARRAAGAG